MERDKNARVERVRRIPFLAALNDGELERILPLLVERTCGRNAMVFKEGDPIEAVYFLQSGLVKVSTLTADGREQVVALLRSGDFFPHVGFLEGGRYPATALAMADSRLTMLRRADLIDLLRHNGDLALRMLATLAQRITDLQQRLKDLTHRDLRVRVRRVLCRLAESHGHAEAGGGMRLGIHLTHQDLAGIVGAARESVTRALAELKQEGIVAADEDGLILLDRQGCIEE